MYSPQHDLHGVDRAGLLISQFPRCLREMVAQKDLVLKLFSGGMVVG